MAAQQIATHPEKISTEPDVITLVRIYWVDTSGQHRCRVVPKKRFDHAVKSGLGLAVACMAFCSFSDSPAPGTNLSGVGEIRLFPDLSTKRRIPWSKQEEMVLGDMYLKPGVTWDYCPRDALKRVAKLLKDEFNLVMKTGFENEYVMLKHVEREGKEDWVPIDSTPYCSAAAFDATAPIFHDVAAALEALNIPVEQYHAEGGKGQFEVVLEYDTCTTSADNVIYTREVIKSVARKHGLLATFVPKYSLDELGSGCHVHISLWENDKNVYMASDGKSKHGMSKVGEEFMAGVLSHLPAILAFTAPVPNSYARIQPNTWSGAYQCWGKDNKEAPIRTACPPGIEHGVVSNFELKAFDGCANPYLGLAAILAAGLDGLRKHIPLPAPVDVNPSELGDAVKRLPGSLSESVEALEKDTVLKELIDEKLLLAITGVRKAEIAHHEVNKEAFKQLIHRY